ncbi:WhiB family transcriptional regulator [Demequina rhizosphaerae]|uniref:WhiB family transcriptional regulator n=1 Tax=Demequina rhizosphaerae TaxID=1638985 RepID=UPI0034E28BF8
MPPDLARSWARLATAADRAHEQRPLPCRGGSDTPSEKWASDRESDQLEAAPECARCPVALLCRRHGIEFPNEAGPYGGLSANQRRTLARKRKERP